MVPDIQDVVSYITSQGIIVISSDSKQIITAHTLGRYNMNIRAEIPDNFPCSLPNFNLVERMKYGLLAHVAWSHSSDYADICYGDKPGYSIDYHVPEIVFLSALNKALEILDQSLNDPEYNQSECMREFGGIWKFHCDPDQSIICIAESSNEISELTIKSPFKNGQKSLSKKFYAINSTNQCNPNHFLIQNSRSKYRFIRGKGILIPISTLILPPSPTESISDWWSKQLAVFSDKLLNQLKDHSRRTKSKEFFIICYAKINDNPVWFGIKCISKQKMPVPLCLEKMNEWSFEAIKVDAVSREIIIPRGGGATNLNDKHVCIAGCGSVGGHIADILASSGIGKLTLLDNDTFKLENLHRHKLAAEHLLTTKVSALKVELESKYPFINIAHKTDSLLTLIEPTKNVLGNSDNLSRFDLIVVATGNISHERMFDEYLRSNNINLPVIYTWLEAYGIGGHAIASIQNKHGCLACAFINNESDEPGLTQNINFIAKNQNLLKSVSGCGTEFIDFSNVDAIQTAAMASRLAIRCLKNEVLSSVVVSWKGSSELCDDNNVELTHRYYHFKNNLFEKPIAREACVICHE